MAAPSADSDEQNFWPGYVDSMVNMVMYLLLLIAILAMAVMYFSMRARDEAKDSKYDFYGEPVVVDKKSELYLEGAKLDFIDGLEQRGFHLEIPMAKKTCGCGSSYQF